MNKTVYMTHILLAFFTLLTITSFAQNHHTTPPTPTYSLVLFENQHYKDWTNDELKSSITKNSDLIDLNICNGQEYVLVPGLLKSNPARSSLKIQSVTTGKSYAYKNGQLYDSIGSALSGIKDNYLLSVLSDLKKISSYKSGSSLIKLLQQSPYTVTIQKNSTPRFSPLSSDGRTNFGFDEASALQYFITLRKTSQLAIPFKQFGAGGFIHFDPQFIHYSIEADGVKRQSKSYIILAHEMYHAFDAVRGLMDRRFVFGDSMENTEVTEYRATYFENTLRKESGLQYIKYYSSNANGTGSLLNAQGIPYQIPSPCLKK